MGRLALASYRIIPSVADYESTVVESTGLKGFESEGLQEKSCSNSKISKEQCTFCRLDVSIGSVKKHVRTGNAGGKKIVFCLLVLPSCKKHFLGFNMF